MRFQNTMELDDEVRGEIEPLMPIQDQIDLTTFELLVAQLHGAFRQRYILGWTAESEAQQLKASAARLWMGEGDVGRAVRVLRSAGVARRRLHGDQWGVPSP